MKACVLWTLPHTFLSMAVIPSPTTRTTRGPGLFGWCFWLRSAFQYASVTASKGRGEGVQWSIHTV